MPHPEAPVLTEHQLAQFEAQGYFIVRQVISRDDAMQVKGTIRNHILMPDADTGGDQHDPMDPMGNSPAARAARFRKLGNYCVQSPVIWHTVDTNPRVVSIARHFLGDNILMKYNSCFLKPALTGSATPWHQDNGLWRDGETEPFNFWMAIDPATRANGCLQFIPGTHREPIVPHVLYADSIHGELPRESVEAMKKKHGGVHYIELEPGDMVCWHSNLYHYSPVNTSPNSRIAVAGVYTNPSIIAKTGVKRQLHWIMRDGKLVESFPPEVFESDGRPHEPTPYARAEDTGIGAAHAGSAA